MDQDKEATPQVQQWLCQWVIDHTSLPAPIDVHADYQTLGLYSMLVVDLLNDIEQHYGVMLDIDVIDKYPDIASLAAHIAEKLSSQ